jgi:hypothetical protein
MSPFDKSYKPTINTQLITRDASISKKASARRDIDMQSGDPLTRLRASGYMGEMSAKTNPAVLKNSKLG